MTRSALWCGAAAVLAIGAATPAMARPQYNAAFKAHFNTASKPTLNAANCGVCHIGPPPQAMWNPFGQAFRRALGAANVQDRAKIVAALDTAAGQRNAAGATFLSRINADQLPGAAAGGGMAAGPSGTWIPLFNGANMNGWTKMNQGNWTVQNNLLTYTGGGNGWLRSNEKFGNYSMVITWRYRERGNNNDSGIFLKAVSEAGNPWPNSPQLNMGPAQNYGSIGGSQGTRARYDLIKPNDWNTFQVTVYNGMASLAINGSSAWEMATGLPTEPGYIGIEAEGRPIEFFSVWVMRLP
jgi:hypothetical protein